MSNNVFDVLKERYIAQTTNEEAIRERLATPGATFISALIQRRTASMSDTL